MIRRLLMLATSVVAFAVAVPVGLARAEDPPETTAPVYIPPPYVVTAPDPCVVVIVVDGPVGPDGPLGPGTSVVAPCGEPLPPLVFDQPATVETAAAAAPVVAARIGYIPAWVMMAYGW